MTSGNHIVFFYFAAVCSFLFVCSCSSSAHAGLTKEDRKLPREQVSLFLTDTTLMVDPVTNEKSYRITKNVTPMTTQEYIKRIHGTNASDDKIDYIYSIDPKDYSTTLFIIHHKKQYVEKISGVRSMKDKGKD